MQHSAALLHPILSDMGKVLVGPDRNLVCRTKDNLLFATICDWGKETDFNCLSMAQFRRKNWIPNQSYLWLVLTKSRFYFMVWQTKPTMTFHLNISFCPLKRCVQMCLLRSWRIRLERRKLIFIKTITMQFMVSNNTKSTCHWMIYQISSGRITKKNILILCSCSVIICLHATL